MARAMTPSFLIDFEQLLQQKELPFEAQLSQICEMLQNAVDYFDWVGFYFADFENKKLHLKAYSGAPTEHTEIPFGKGICGQVAVSNQNFLVPDVHAQSNYIACSLDVQSEIVIPIFADGKNIGQIDIDSHTPNAFDKADEKFLEQLCSLIGTAYASNYKVNE